MKIMAKWFCLIKIKWTIFFFRFSVPLHWFDLIEHTYGAHRMENQMQTQTFRILVAEFKWKNADEIL